MIEGKRADAPVSTISPLSAVADGLHGLRILLAEDHPQMQIAVGRLLTFAGASIARAHDGREATEMALREPFDVVLMDLRMPRMDGFEAARLVRAARCAVPIVALTADPTPQVRAEALGAGCNAVLGKPFGLADLIREIALDRGGRAGRV